MTSDQAAFRQRCQQALTHPVTLGAVGVLLLNDLLLKGLWPNPWTTGKLSDLAWVIFAPPLLAYLLSLAAPGTQWARRTVWATAYIGLPLLYAAFNTFAPLHDAILRSLSLLSGGAGGSPLDATDSLVIPVGLAVALWVWRRGQSGLTISRQQIALAAAGLAVFAAIASSQPRPAIGVDGFQPTDQNELTAYCAGSNPVAHKWAYGPYTSTNGGLDWQLNPNDDHPPYPTLDQRKAVATPRGTYSVGESGIVHSESGANPVYATEYLLSPAARWLQEHGTSHLSPQFIATGPLAITYDAGSDNVIAAMGIQGVVVGTPDGKWTRVAVGPCRPTDFSFLGKVGVLLGNSGFYILTLFLPIAVVTFAVSIAAVRLGTAPGCWAELLHIAAIALSALAILDAAILLWTFESHPGAADVLNKYMLNAAILIGCGLVFAAFAMSIGSYARKDFLISVSAIAALALAAQVILALLVWINSDFSPLFVKISIVAMAILTGYALQRYLTRKERTTRAAPPSAGIDHHPDGQ